METKQNIYMLIMAAGSGTRAKTAVPKQYAPIAGRPLLRHTVEKCLTIPGLTGLKVVIHPDHTALYEEAVGNLNLPPPVHGSNTRKNSVFNGLKSFSQAKSDDIVLIHDAARPFIFINKINQLIDFLQVKRAGTLALPVYDTIRHEDGTVLDRNALWTVQTPQGFHAATICSAHEKFKDDDSFTDDAGMVQAMGIDVGLIEGNRENIKITTAEDFMMAETMLGAQNKSRTATGFDVHAFDEVPAQFIRIGGIDITHDRALKGHSDADVALHAITDALLGTIAAGDIGALFPPSDPQWKGADSALFLKEAVRLVTEKGATITHLDLTILCEAPKIGPHRTAMQQRIADICAIQPDQVSIKATTTEGLGFTGRKEGVAAQACATIS